jgi:exosortase/archaeosortase
MRASSQQNISLQLCAKLFVLIIAVVVTTLLLFCLFSRKEFSSVISYLHMHCRVMEVSFFLFASIDCRSIWYIVCESKSDILCAFRDVLCKLSVT